MHVLSGFVLLLLAISIVDAQYLRRPRCPPAKCRELPRVQKKCLKPTFTNINGRRCPGCLKNTCSTANILPCPNNKCPVVYIRKSCRENTFSTHKGKKCKACPKNKCRCPETRCKTYLLGIPDKCIKRRFIYKNGKRCEICPKITCREYLTLPCPNITCSAPPTILLPRKCFNRTIGTSSEKKCLGCIENICCPDDILPCPNLKCPRKSRKIPQFCQEFSYPKYNGKICKGCPENKCEIFTPPDEYKLPKMI